MRDSLVNVTVHCVWHTWDNLPLITPELKQVIYPAMIAKCRQMRCWEKAIGGIEGHVHLVAQLAPSVSVAELVKQVKGSSSHLAAHHADASGAFFKWQGAYFAASVNPQELDGLIRYVNNQETHHRNRTIIPEWEAPPD